MNEENINVNELTISGTIIGIYNILLINGHNITIIY